MRGVVALAPPLATVGLMVQDATGLPKPITVAVAIASMAAVVAVAYRIDRAYSRWMTRVNPLTTPREWVAHLRTGYRVRREDAFEFTQVINELLDEVARARRDMG